MLSVIVQVRSRYSIRTRVDVMRVIISERRFAPIAHVESQIRSGGQPAARAFVEVNRSIEEPVAIPIVGAQQVRPENRPVSWNKLEIVRMFL